MPGREPLLTSLSLALLAARRSGVAILDGVHNDVRDLEGFAAECRQGRDLGFDGKTLIHPGQVEPCNEVFAPSAEEVEEARELLAAWDAGAGAGVVTHRGRMVENLHVEIARTVIAMVRPLRVGSELIEYERHWNRPSTCTPMPTYCPGRWS